MPNDVPIAPPLRASSREVLRATEEQRRQVMEMPTTIPLQFLPSSPSKLRDSTRENQVTKIFSNRDGVPSTITCDLSFPTTLSPANSVDMLNDDEGLVSDELTTCLKLLENDRSLDSCSFGMEVLVKLVNSELVNMKRDDSISRALICGVELGRQLETKRLRKIILSCFERKSFDFYVDGLSSDSSESDLSSISTRSGDGALTASSPHLGEYKLPALRILTSSLNLVTMLDPQQQDIDLSSSFWVSILGSMSNLGDVNASNRLEATLSIKCIRLLHQLQPTVMCPFIRYSVLPYVVNAREFGDQTRDRRLKREATSLLEEAGITL